jgi:hypothetical protein
MFTYMLVLFRIGDQQLNLGNHNMPCGRVSILILKLGTRTPNAELN